jgi:hypothetical protein
MAPLLALALATVAAAPRRTLHFPAHLRALDFALGLIVFGLLVQLTPWPAGLVRAISPHALAATDAARLSSLQRESTAWATLSIAPRETVAALGTLSLGVLAFWGARAAFIDGGTRRFCRWLAVIGAAASLLALITRAVAPGSILGLARPAAQSANPFGAFVNRNHFSAWLLMMAAPVVGYLIAHASTHPGYRRRRVFQEALASGAVLVAMAALLMIGVLLLTLSRSALAALAATGVAGWAFMHRRSALPRPMTILTVGAAIAVVGVLDETARIGNE